MNRKDVCMLTEEHLKIRALIEASNSSQGVISKKVTSFFNPLEDIYSELGIPNIGGNQ